MSRTSIEWCNIPGYLPEVWNPVTGCTRVSSGCDNCYAIRQSEFCANMGAKKYQGVTIRPTFSDVDSKDLDAVDKVDWSGRVKCHEDLLDLPLRWTKPRAVFVNSMSDLFHDDVPGEFIEKVWGTMAKAKEHTFLILTKRPLKMSVIVRRYLTSPDGNPLASNVWLGVSCENQAMADQRIPHLLKTPAAVRFVSLEPMLGPIDLSQWLKIHRLGGSLPTWTENTGEGSELNWVICGGESGQGARPMHPDWARSVRDQCKAAGVRFFFKQWGEWAPDCLCGKPAPCVAIPRPEPGKLGAMFRCGKKAAGDLLDGVQYHEWPEVGR